MVDNTVSLDAREWAEYFGSISAGAGYLASVAVLSGTGEHVPQATAHPLRSIAYHADEDVLEAVVGKGSPRSPLVRYFISDPRRIGVREADDGRAIVVDDASGLRTLIWLCSAETATASGAVAARPWE
jgi:hypothetical protein